LSIGPAEVVVVVNADAVAVVVEHEATTRASAKFISVEVDGIVLARIVRGARGQGGCGEC
jgi:hypothetical protein